MKKAYNEKDRHEAPSATRSRATCFPICHILSVSAGLLSLARLSEPVTKSQFDPPPADDFIFIISPKVPVTRTTPLILNRRGQAIPPIAGTACTSARSFIIDTFPGSLEVKPDHTHMYRRCVGVRCVSLPLKEFQKVIDIGRLYFELIRGCA